MRDLGAVKNGVFQLCQQADLYRIPGTGYVKEKISASTTDACSMTHPATPSHPNVVWVEDLGEAKANKAGPQAKKMHPTRDSRRTCGNIPRILTRVEGTHRTDD
ncbi:hypothetical protein Bbelb_306890 [Branchiostoma belcheri]|nr:hypothetical protein Bbelb_306890 [Branchiostoma belcheri]